MTERVLVLGDGGWGTALAMVLVERGLQVTLWGRSPEYVQVMARTRRNPKYLPGVTIPDDIRLTSELAEATRADVIFAAVPSKFLRSVMLEFAPVYPRNRTMVSAAKGIENDSLMRPTEIIRSILGADVPTVVISGPSHAEEVSRRMPTTIVAASDDMGRARRIQDLLHTERFRVYTNDDEIGVELGGALKNVIAIAGGIVDGLGFGDNTKAALLTRGIVEMARLGVAMGAKRETFFGLAGIGDLITSCISPHGRNRGVGEKLGRGQKLEQILARMEQVAEGVHTSKSVCQLAEKLAVEMPICQQVERVLFEGKEPSVAVRDLMTRGLKDEWDW
ncbi:MAG: NAD(P)H-dependent glycerol-3-phosphate dehydrogenase [Planctomycetota bacterium]